MIGQLIAKLERAPRGDHELTADVYEALGCEVIRSPRTPNGIAWRYRGINPAGRLAVRWEMMKRFTESFDDAMDLVPKAPWPWNVTMASYYGSVSVIPCEPNSAGIHDERCGHAHGAKTIALGLCIAALRARLAMSSRKAA